MLVVLPLLKFIFDVRFSRDENLMLIAVAQVSHAIDEHALKPAAESRVLWIDHDFSVSMFALLDALWEHLSAFAAALG